MASYSEDGDALLSDLILLGDLNEKSVLEVLHERYKKDKIYTWCGDVLLSVNPFKQLPLYDVTQHDNYTIENLQHDMEPHVFHVAASAFKRLQESKTNQIMLVSGESGSGKTENTKYMVKHLMKICVDSQGDLHERILQVNPLIEAFGNAKTTLNDNSSRFVKYLQLDFSRDQNILGATIRDYMLEKSRIVHQGRGEGNFHIFYSFLAGLSESDRTMLSVKETDDFRIAVINDGMARQRDADSYHQCLAILDQIGVTIGEKESVQTILAAIFHLTNIEFLEDDEYSSSIDDESHLITVNNLLETNEESLVKVLVTKKIRIRGQDEEIDMVRSKRDAEGGRDALAKALYERLFGWIIRKVNISLHPNYDTADSAGNIGILDICGFECLTENSFEQMCINLVNEKMQGYMNEQIFKRERQIYETQGVTVACADVDYNHNDEILAMFMNKGVLHMIDEDTNLGQATDNTLVRKLGKKFGSNANFRKMLGDGTTFAIRHFAKEVSYNAQGFLEKNRDTLSQDMIDCMKTSTNAMVADLFTVKKSDTGSISRTQYNYHASKRRSTRTRVQPDANLSRSIVSDLRNSHKQRFGKVVTSGEEERKPTQTVIGYFQHSLKDLIVYLDCSEARFVRCIKPNERLWPDGFDKRAVLEQLQYNGIAEVARVRKQGWPIRRKYTEMLTRFNKLSSKSSTLPSLKSATEAILRETRVSSSDFVLGKDMVFMKYAAMEHLENELKKRPMTPPIGEIETQSVEDLPSKHYLGVSLSTIGEESESGTPKVSIRRKSVSEKSTDQVRPSVSFSFQTEDRVPSTPTPKGSLNAAVSSSTIHPTVQIKDKEETQVKHVDCSPRNTENGAAANPILEESSASNNSDLSFWDMFRIVDTEKPRKESYDQMTLKVVKVIVYILLFLFLLLACVGQRVGLMLLVSNLPAGPTNKRMDHYHYTYLAIVILIPYILTSLWSFFKWLFGNTPTPGVLTWLTVLPIEALHSFGLSVMVFYVLPKYDLILGSLLLSATSILPSILMITCTSWTISGDTMSKAGLKKILDFFAFLCQVSVVPVIFFLNRFGKINSPPVNPFDTAALAVAFVLSSLKCWENFIDGKTTTGASTGKNNCVMNKILKIRYELQEGRYCVSMVSGLVKIIITCGVIYGVMILHTPQHDISETSKRIISIFPVYSDLYKYPIRFSALLLVTISGFVAYQTSYTACKLQMQIVSFSIPLLLCLPVTQGVLALNCYYYDILKYISIYKNNCDDCGQQYCYYYYFGVAWLMSLLWMTRHIWSPKQGRLEEFDSLFINPFYCGVLTQENLLLNRRRHNEKITYHGQQYFIVKPKKIRQDAESISGLPYSSRTDASSSDIPFIYACATMWHETRTEMTQLLKSFFRLDRDQALKETYAMFRGSNDLRDRYNYQAHIFLDDALELNDEDKWQANQFVRQLVEVMDEACSAVHQRPMDVHDPYKVITPYGAQLIWEMPGGNVLYAHLKDKEKIRHRKRWSQVMYMYYLLGYQLLKDSAEEVLKHFYDLNRAEMNKLFNMDIQKKTKNTFILALDGDTDFSPGSVQVLLDKMMANDKVAAVCGRIHPTGSGPMVWYQKFEYAVGHWLQKATEHVLGCVLCSPGCFSLFRASAIMDDNIMRKYAILPTAPGDYLQFDQGEDRWLCTLLLQQGYRVDYAAAADAYTQAPEGFNEFFNQRRRWTPSTLANILDLLSSSDKTVARNSNISFLYIFYQIAMMFGTVLGPATVIMMIAGAMGVVFELSLLWSYAISLIIPAFYIIICCTASTKIQLIVAAVLSALYSFIMMAVITGTVVTSFTISPVHPSVIFTCLLFFMFVFAGILHWKEINCLPHCLLYFLCIPTGYLILFIYSLANLNNVSWGTREIPKRKSKKEAEEEKRKEEERKKNEKKKDGFIARFLFSSSYFQEMRRLIDSMKPKLLSNKTSDDKIVELLKEMNNNIALLAGTKTNVENPPPSLQSKIEAEAHQQPDYSETAQQTKAEIDEEQNVDHYGRVHWVRDKSLGNEEVWQLCSKEETFWKMFVERYLKPLEKNPEKEKKVKNDLIELRNNVCLSMVLINGLWIAVNFMFQLNEQVAGITIKYMEKNEQKKVTVSILGMLFILFFTVLIVIQFFGMIIHRWETLLHLISMTRLGREEEGSEMASEKKMLVEKLYEPAPDYDIDDDDNDEENKAREDRIRSVVLGGQTGRTLAQSRRQEGLKASQRFANQLPDLRSTLLNNGLETLRLRRMNTHRPSNISLTDIASDQGVRGSSELRHRFIKPDVLDVAARERGLSLDRLRPRQPHNAQFYDEIRNFLPGKMGKHLARGITHLGVEIGNNGMAFVENVDTNSTI